MPMPVPRTLATAMPMRRPLSSTTGPPLLPGLRSPSIWMTPTSPRSFWRTLEIVPLPTVTAGSPLEIDNASPNGKPNV